MSTYTFTVYETDNAYYSSTDGFVLSTDTLTITDSDGQLHQDVANDPGGDQSFDFASQPAVTSYTVAFLDFAQVNSAGPSYEVYAMRVDFGGTLRYYVMSKDPGFAPDPGDRLTVTSFSAFTNTNYTDIAAMTCFLTGTKIETSMGPRPIETLKAGDLISTIDHGPQPLRKIVTRQLDRQTLQRAPQWRPILIRTLQRPLFVSPQHRMLLRSGDGAEWLVPAKLIAEELPHLARVAWGKRDVCYMHLLFDRHEVILAEGQPTESMFLGAQGLASMDRATKGELLALFPSLLQHLMSGRVAQTAGLARPIMRRQQVRRMKDELCLAEPVRTRAIA